MGGIQTLPSTHPLWIFSWAPRPHSHVTRVLKKTALNLVNWAVLGAYPQLFLNVHFCCKSILPSCFSLSLFPGHWLNSFLCGDKNLGHVHTRVISQYWLFSQTQLSGSGDGPVQSISDWPRDKVASQNLCLRLWTQAQRLVKAARLHLQCKQPILSPSSVSNPPFCQCVHWAAAGDGSNYWGPQHPAALCSQLLGLIWSSPGCCQHLGNEPVDRRSLFHIKIN